MPTPVVSAPARDEAATVDAAAGLTSRFESRAEILWCSLSAKNDLAEEDLDLDGRLEATHESREIGDAGGGSSKYG
ncbi:unnamed protein product [Ectocarpus sp. 6 AP-2014]